MSTCRLAYFYWSHEGCHDLASLNLNRPTQEAHLTKAASLPRERGGHAFATQPRDRAPSDFLFRVLTLQRTRSGAVYGLEFSSSTLWRSLPLARAYILTYTRERYQAWGGASSGEMQRGGELWCQRDTAVSVTEITPQNCTKSRSKRSTAKCGLLPRHRAQDACGRTGSREEIELEAS